jgi:hypothetical protein
MFRDRFARWSQCLKNAALSQRLLFSKKRRVARRKQSSAFGNTSAEVLEIRQMLTADVAAVANGSQVTVTSDNNGDHAIEIYRVNAHVINVVALNGCTVNGDPSAELEVDYISNITVNLGSGKDTYQILSMPGHPALNVGSGGITFQGDGGLGDSLLVSNASNNLMTIQGAITVQGATVGSPLTESEATNVGLPLGFDLYSNVGGITVGGKISVNESETGGAPLTNKIESGDGNLDLKGTTTLVVTSGNAQIENDVEAGGSGQLTMLYGLTELADSTTGKSVNQLLTDSTAPGNILIESGVDQEGQSSGEHDNEVRSHVGSITVYDSVKQDGAGSQSVDQTNIVESEGGGNVKIGILWGTLTQTASGSDSATNDFGATSSGNVTVNGYVSQFVIQSAGTMNNDVFDVGSGNMTIHSSLQQQSTVGSGTITNDVYNSGVGKFFVGAGGININTQSDTSGADITNIVNNVYTGGQANFGFGTLTCKGLVNITSTNNNSQSSDTTLTTLETTPGGGQLSLSGILINNHGPMTQQNWIIANGAEISIGHGGVSITSSGQGPSDDRIVSLSAYSPIYNLGGVSVTEQGNGQSRFIMTTDSANSPITVGGNVNYDNHLNHWGTSFVSIDGHSNVANDRLQIDGALVLILANSSGGVSGNGIAFNQVNIGSNKGNAAPNGTTIYGVTKITGDNGPDQVLFTDTTFVKNVTVTLNGTTMVGFIGAPISDSLTINGCAFQGSTTVTMTGPSSNLAIDNGGADSATQFGGKFVANLTGSSPTTLISAGLGPGYTKAVFGQGATFNGAQNSGGVLKYHAANVFGSISHPNFVVQFG